VTELVRRCSDLRLLYLRAMKNIAAPYAAAAPTAAIAAAAAVVLVAGELLWESVLKTPLPPPPAVADGDAPVPLASTGPSIWFPGMRGMVGFIYCIS
jgi:hypothetical protein